MTSHLRPGHPRRLLAVFAAGALIVIAVNVTMIEPAAADGNPERPTAIVAMGDSLSAGEGGGRYEPGSNEFGRYCHRSPAAEINHAKPHGVTTAVNLACSAATTDDISLGGTSRYGEPPQAEQLKTVARTHNVRSIVLTVGANDISTVVMTVECILAYLSGGSCGPRWAQQLPQRLRAIQPRVVDNLNDIRTVMRSAGYADNSYDLIVQSYPSPSGGLSRYSATARALNGCPFHDDDIAWFHQVGFPMITEYLRQAAASVRGVRFLGLTTALEGRQVCTPGISHDQEWMWGTFVDLSGLRTGPGPHLFSQSLHPNAVGYKQLAWCLREFHASTAKTAHCARDADGRMGLGRSCQRGRPCGVSEVSVGL